MYKILIADDEPIERLVARKFVDTHFKDRLVSEIAENGSDAVEIFQKEKCEIALLDIEMPGMNGLTAAEHIRKECPQAQIIFLTAYDDFNYARHAITVRALDYLLKPVDDGELTMTLEEAIRLLDAYHEKEDREKKIESDQNDPENKETSQPAKTAGTTIAEDGEEGSGKLSAIRYQISEYLDENYMRDLALSDVAGVFNYSDAYFCKVFKQCFGVSFVMYLANLRIGKAKEMLGDIRINIKEISGLVGYQDSNYFTRVFKRAENMTPSEYRNKMLGEK